MEQFLKRHVVLSLIAVFLLGGFTFWGGDKIWTHYHRERSESTPLALSKELPNFDDLFGPDFFKQSRDPFQEMDRLHRQMMKNFGESGSGEDHFGGWFQENFGGGVPSDFRMREDKDFVYYEIESGNELPKNLDVNVQNGQVTIKGEIEKKSEGSGSASLYSSSFVRSFPAPEGVDAQKFQIEQQDKKVVIKFPKSKGV